MLYILCIYNVCAQCQIFPGHSSKLLTHLHLIPILCKHLYKFRYNNRYDALKIMNNRLVAFILLDTRKHFNKLILNDVLLIELKPFQIPLTNENWKFGNCEFLKYDIFYAINTVKPLLFLVSYKKKYILFF